MRTVSDIVLLQGKWLANLKKSIEANGYCPVCEHVLHHKECPLNPNSVTYTQAAK